MKSRDNEMLPILVRSAQKYLGRDYDWRISTEILSTATRAEISHIDVRTKGSEYRTICEQNRESCLKKLFVDFGIKLDIPGSPAGGGAGSLVTKSTGTDSENYHLFMMGLIRHDCILNQTPSVISELRQDSCYLQRGILTVGYIVEIQVDVHEKRKDFQTRVTAEATTPHINIIRGHFAVGSGKSTREHADISNVSVRGIGGYNVPAGVRNKAASESYARYLDRLLQELGKDFDNAFRESEPEFQILKVMPYYPSKHVELHSTLLRGYALLYQEIERVSETLGIDLDSDLSVDMRIVGIAELRETRNDIHREITILEILVAIPQSVEQEFIFRYKSLQNKAFQQVQNIKEKQVISLKYPIHIQSLDINDVASLKAGFFLTLLAGRQQCCIYSASAHEALSFYIEPVQNASFLTHREQAFYLRFGIDDTSQKYLKVSGLSREEAGSNKGNDDVGVKAVMRKEATLWSFQAEGQLHFRQFGDLINVTPSATKAGYKLCGSRADHIVYASPAGSGSIQLVPHDICNLNNRLETHLTEISSVLAALDIVVDRLHIPIERFPLPSFDTSVVKAVSDSYISIIQTPSGGFEVDLPADNSDRFSGREEDLNRVYEALNSGHAVITQRKTITGFGGVGKTELAIQYVYRYRNNYQVIIWVDAEEQKNMEYIFLSIAKTLSIPTEVFELSSDSPTMAYEPEVSTTGVNASRSLAERLGTLISDEPKSHRSVGPDIKCELLKASASKERPMGDIVRDIYRKLVRGDRPWIIIFDNVETHEHVKPFLPENKAEFQSKTGHILITSRSRQWGKGIGIELGLFSFEDARAFFHKELPNALLTDVDRLSEQLGFLPLALAQAVAYISENAISIEKYLQDFEQKRREYLLVRPDAEETANVKRTVLTTWNLSIEKIREQSPLAVNILIHCAYLDPSNIQKFIFENLRSDHLATTEVVDAAIKLLRQYSLITTTQENEAFKIHRLLQEVIQIHQIEKESVLHWIGSTGERMGREAEYPLILDAAKQLVPLFLFNEDNGLLDERKSLPILIHVQKLLAYAERYKVDSLELTHLRRLLMFYYAYTRMDLIEAMMHAQMINVSFLTEEDQAKFYITLCFLYDMNLEKKQSQLYLEKAASLIGTEPSFLLVICLLRKGYVLLQLRHISGAQQLFQGALDVLTSLDPEKRFYPVTWSNVLQSLGSISSDRSLKKHYLEASFSLIENQRPNPSVSTQACSLGNMYLEEENYIKAKEYYQRAESCLTFLFGIEPNRNLGFLMDHFANLYYQQRQYQESISYRRRQNQIGRAIHNQAMIATALYGEGLSLLAELNTNKQNEAKKAQLTNVAFAPETLAAAPLDVISTGQIELSAKSCFTEAAQLFVTVSDDNMGMHAHLRLIELAMDATDEIEARRLYQKALQFLEKLAQDSEGTEIDPFRYSSAVTRVTEINLRTFLRVAEMHYLMGNVWRNHYCYQEALKCYEAAIRTLGEKNTDWVMNLNKNMMHALRSFITNCEVTACHLDATVLAETLFMLCERRGECVWSRDILAGLANCYLELKEYAKAENLYLRALALCEKQFSNAREAAEANLQEFACTLGIDCKFNEQNTCIVSIDKALTLHLTYEPNSCRLYLYAPVLDGLPKNPDVKLQLYETLLEGSMLGGMAGGGVGVALKEELILMHMVLSMENAHPFALTDSVPIFLASIEKWISICRNICVESITTLVSARSQPAVVQAKKDESNYTRSKILKKLQRCYSEQNNIAKLDQIQLQEKSETSHFLNLAREQLRELTTELRLNLQFDANYTCILGIDNAFSFHITYQPESRCLYIYSPVRDSMPPVSVKLRFYEQLLEGALLGGQMAGGGVGVVVSQELFLMHISIPLEAPSSTLKRLAPLFVEAIKKWRKIATEICVPFSSLGSLATTPHSLFAGSSTNRENIEIPLLKEYYRSQSSFFNASKGIFDGKERDEVLKTLDRRARNNPRGASEKTLQRFGLK